MLNNDVVHYLDAQGAHETDMDTIEQGTPEWFEARLGNITASRMVDVMAKTKTGYGAGRKNYMMELLCQRLTGDREDSYTNAIMQRGIDLEPLARAAYEVETGNTVDEVGFVVNPDIEHMGASPDGLVGDDGLIEIKCPNTAQHVACLQSGKPDAKYIKQMHAQMICTGRAWCDFVSFDDRMPDEIQMFVVRVERDDKLVEEMLEAVKVFLEDLDALTADMAKLMEEAA